MDLDKEWLNLNKLSDIIEHYTNKNDEEVIQLIRDNIQSKDDVEVLILKINILERERKLNRICK